MQTLKIQTFSYNFDGYIVGGCYYYKINDNITELETICPQQAIKNFSSSVRDYN